MAQTFTIDPDGRARRFLQRAAKAVSDFRPALKDVKKYQLEEIKKQFSSQGTRMVGGKWKKRKKAVSWPILDKTGKLKKSFKQTKLTKTELHVTSKVKHYKYHQSGKPRKSNLPRRQILGWSSRMIKKTGDILMKHIIKKTKHG